MGEPGTREAGRYRARSPPERSFSAHAMHDSSGAPRRAEGCFSSLSRRPRRRRKKILRRWKNWSVHGTGRERERRRGRENGKVPESLSPLFFTASSIVSKNVTDEEDYVSCLRSPLSSLENVCLLMEIRNG